MDGKNDPNEMLAQVCEAGKRRQLKLNTSKTKCKVIGTHAQKKRVNVNGENIDNVSKFKYSVT